MPNRKYDSFVKAVTAAINEYDGGGDYWKCYCAKSLGTMFAGYEQNGVYRTMAHRKDWKRFIPMAERMAMETPRQI
jgi:hypothetical protein